MKAKLLKQNKHHLQHMVKEKTPSSWEVFHELLSNFGTSPTSSKIVENNVTTELNQFPQVKRVWLQ